MHQTPSAQPVDPGGVEGGRRNVVTPIVILFAIASILFGISFCINASQANDLFWQLRTGSEIVQNHAVPHENTFSFRRAGTPWVVHEWLTFVLFWLAFQAHGLGGVWLLQAAVVGLFSLALFCVIYRHSGGSPLIALAMTTFAQLAASLFFQPRPQIFTYLFTIIFTGACLGARQEKPRRIYWILPLIVLWANLHAGVLIGIGLLLGFAVCDALESRFRKDLSPEVSLARTESCVHLGIAGGIGMLLTLVTPYSWHVYQNFGATISNTTMLDTVLEWLSPNFHDGFGKTVEAYMFLLVAAFCASPRQKSLAEIVLSGLLIHEALVSSRNVPLLVFVTSPFLATHIQACLQKLLGYQDEISFWASDSLFARRMPVIPAIAVVVALGAIGAGRAADVLKRKDSQKTPPLEHLARLCYAVASLPENACAFVKKEGIPTNVRMYNIYGDGGYIIWALPEHPVFIDGRADVYFGKPLEEVTKMSSLPYQWQNLLDRYKCDMIIADISSPQSRLFLASKQWAIVYLDRPVLSEKETPLDNSYVMLRRSAAYADLIAKCRKDCPALQTDLSARYPDLAAFK